MRGVSYWFFLSAACYVLAGMILGIHMGISQDHSLAPAHAHLNLVGWVSMALFGTFYHLVPAAAESRLAKIHFGLATIGLWLFVPGIVVRILDGAEAFVIAGSLVTISSMALFVFIVATKGRASSASSLNI